MARCDNCLANKVCDHNRFGFENCENYISSDVVPKSEVEKLEQDVTRLVQEKDALVKNYAECMRDYARVIFEEIAREVASKIPMKITPIFKRDLDYDAGRTDGERSAFCEVIALMAKLKKKHTERCPDCKHFVGCECFSGQTCDEYEEGEK